MGANVNSTWASQSHFPALLASPDVEFTAVCTTRPESAEEARRAFGAKLAFHDFREMAASPDIDAIAVVVRVPAHYEPTRAAIEGESTSIPSGPWAATLPRRWNWRIWPGRRVCRPPWASSRGSVPP